MNYKKHITYKPTINRIDIDGTDGFFDLFVTMNSRPNSLGFHSGCYAAAEFIFSETKHRFDKSKELDIFGHSMGGGIAQCLADMFTKIGFTVILHTFESYPTVPKKYYNPMFRGLSIEYGSDPIPLLFKKKYGYAVKHQHIGPKRTKWKTFIQCFLFLLGKGDHVEKY